MNNYIPYAKKDILGVRFNLVTYTDVMKTIQYWKANRETNYITLTNPFCVTCCFRDLEMWKAIDNAGMTLPDGIGIIIAAWLFKYLHNGRISGPTLMLKLCDWGRKYGYRHYFYGGAEKVADKLAERLLRIYPGLDIAGTYCPPFRSLSEKENNAIIERINSSYPDIVWIGLGAPKQEKWMASNVRRINATAMIGVGAAFDFHSGNVKWAPRLIQDIGLEGIYYLAFRPCRTLPKLYGTSLFTAMMIRLCLKQKLKKIISIYSSL